MAGTYGRPSAVAVVKGDRSNPLLRGTVRFYQRPYGILVEAELTGLPSNLDGFFGFYIHDGSSCMGERFLATGGHYDQKRNTHPRHAGDLPPLLSYGGRAYMTVVSDRFSIREIIGRTVVIHGKTDDFRSQPSGDAGEKIACGVIIKR